VAQARGLKEPDQGSHGLTAAQVLRTGSDAELCLDAFDFFIHGRDARAQPL
jgi:hypothetical protein